MAMRTNVVGGVQAAADPVEGDLAALHLHSRKLLAAKEAGISDVNPGLLFHTILSSAYQAAVQSSNACQCSGGDHSPHSSRSSPRRP